MYINNYDQSSTGTNLELSASLDGSTARFWFEESFIKVPNDLRPRGYYGDCYWYSWEGKPPQEISGWFDLSKVSARQLVRHFIVWRLGENFGYRELADFFHQYDLSFKHSAELSVDNLVFFIDRELQDSELAEFYSELAPIKFDYHQSRGYCQGDAVTVFYSPEEGEELTEDIDHLFWDSPSYIRLTVDDEEIYLDEYLEGFYTYDKDELIAKVIASGEDWATEQVIDFLRDNLPSDLPYVG